MFEKIVLGLFVGVFLAILLSLLIGESRGDAPGPLPYCNGQLTAAGTACVWSNGLDRYGQPS